MSARRRTRKHVPDGAKPTPAPLGKTCGANGGRNTDGTPCGRAPGWGVPPEKVPEAPGLCRDHRPDHASMIQAAKKAFVQLFATGLPSLQEAALQAAGVDASTIWLWRQQDPTFDEAVRLAKLTNRAIRCEELEDSAFARAVRGECAAALEIFLLHNYSDGRLKHRLELTGAGGTPLLPVETVQKILGDG